MAIIGERKMGRQAYYQLKVKWNRKLKENGFKEIEYGASRRLFSSMPSRKQVDISEDWDGVLFKIRAESYHPDFYTDDSVKRNNIKDRINKHQFKDGLAHLLDRHLRLVYIHLLGGISWKITAEKFGIHHNKNYGTFAGWRRKLSQVNFIARQKHYAYVVNRLNEEELEIYADVFIRKNSFRWAVDSRNILPENASWDQMNSWYKKTYKEKFNNLKQEFEESLQK